ncbi:MAG: DUF401 family protein [Candidatus Altiarchaeales archaeon]|nr:DUF401 family protein [Candidatus Altiarchaeales archaeon]MBD3415704.1 DUF401 family protein [Candidatus Altiarchaeales archaeon]
MLVLAKILFVFAAMVLLIRRGFNVGYALIAASLVLGFLFGMTPGRLSYSMFEGATELDTINLLAIVWLITLLGNVLKHTENLQKAVESIQHILGDTRVVLASIPAFIGLMPMPGGAMLSAPLAGEVAENAGVDANTKTAINYWFRHVWEYMFPLYPAVVLSAALLDITYAEIAVANGPLTLAAIVGGWYMLLRHVKKSDYVGYGDFLARFKVLVGSIWPIAAVIVANLVFGINLVLVLLAVLSVVFIQSGFFRGFRHRVFRETITLNLTLLILSVMVFKSVIEDSGAVNELPSFFEGAGIPAPLILFTVPFIVGALTGITVAAVGSTFPLLMAFIASAGVDYGNFMVAYMGAFMGVMMSPVHLCLVLTNEYYGSDFNRVYRKVVRVVGAAVAVMVVLYIMGWPAMVLG